MKKLLVVLSLVLAGCTPEQANRIANQLNPDREAQQIRVAIDQECADMGAPRGTPNYYNCRMHFEQMFIQAALIGSNQGLPVGSISQYTALPSSAYNPKIQCDSKEFFGQLKTVCY